MMLSISSLYAWSLSSVFFSPALLAAPPATMGRREFVTLENVDGEPKALMLMNMKMNESSRIVMLVTNAITKSLTERPKLLIASRMTIFFTSAMPRKNYEKLRSPVLSLSALENI